jgi:hypothetical protein
VGGSWTPTREADRVDLTPEVAFPYIEHAYRQMLGVVDRLGDDRMTVKPHGPSTNTASALVAHSLGVLEFWLGHVALDRPSARDRDSEFVAELTVAEAHERVEAGLAQAAVDLRTMADHEERNSGLADDLSGGTGDASLVLHILEEAYQHLGHLELTADALLSP